MFPHGLRYIISSNYTKAAPQHLSNQVSGSNLTNRSHICRKHLIKSSVKSPTLWLLCDGQQCPCEVYLRPVCDKIWSLSLCQATGPCSSSVDRRVCARVSGPGIGLATLLPFSCLTGLWHSGEASHIGFPFMLYENVIVLGGFLGIALVTACPRKRHTCAFCSASGQCATRETKSKTNMLFAYKVWRPLKRRNCLYFLMLL